METMTYELLTATTIEELMARIDASGARLRGVARGAEPAAVVPGSTWRVRDVVAHVVTVIRRYTRGVTIGDHPRDVDRINEDELATLADLEIDQLLAEHEQELAALRDGWGQLTDLTTTFPFHGGAAVDAAAALANVVGEHLVHGRDIAMAAGEPWEIAERDAVLVLNGVVQILPGYVRTDAPTEPFAARLELPGAVPWLLAFDGAELVSRAAGEADRVDAVLTDAGSVLLALYGRSDANDLAWVRELDARLERP